MTAPSILLKNKLMMINMNGGAIVRSGKACPVRISRRFYDDYFNEAKKSDKGFYGKYPLKTYPNKSL